MNSHSHFHFPFLLAPIANFMLISFIFEFPFENYYTLQLSAITWGRAGSLGEAAGASIQLKGFFFEILIVKIQIGGDYLFTGDDKN